jgi:hypothetical protein
MSNIERPGDDYPPSRRLGIAFWPQILGAMGIHVAPPGGGG